VRIGRRPTGTTPGTASPRFPGYDVVSQRHTWDEETAGVVLGRLAPPPEPVRFFTEHERPTARALLDRLLGQDDEPRIPVLEMVDERLLAGDGDGYRYHDMPEDPEAWRRSIAGLDADAETQWGRLFHQLRTDQQMALIEDVRTADGMWQGLPAARVFSLWLRYGCATFYAHPWAWNEIGFGGPAYPRGYANIGLNRREPWERPERDAHDPIGWVERAEAARAAHDAGLRAERGA